MSEHVDLFADIDIVRQGAQGDFYDLSNWIGEGKPWVLSTVLQWLRDRIDDHREWNTVRTVMLNQVYLVVARNLHDADSVEMAIVLTASTDDGYIERASAALHGFNEYYGKDYKPHTGVSRTQLYELKGYVGHASLGSNWAPTDKAYREFNATFVEFRIAPIVAELRKGNWVLSWLFERLVSVTYPQSSARDIASTDLRIRHAITALYSTQLLDEMPERLRAHWMKNDMGQFAKSLARPTEHDDGALDIYFASIVGPLMGYETWFGKKFPDYLPESPESQTGSMLADVIVESGVLKSYGKLPRNYDIFRGQLEVLLPRFSDDSTESSTESSDESDDSDGRAPAKRKPFLSKREKELAVNAAIAKTLAKPPWYEKELARARAHDARNAAKKARNDATRKEYQEEFANFDMEAVMKARRKAAWKAAGDAAEEARDESKDKRARSDKAAAKEAKKRAEEDALRQAAKAKKGAKKAGTSESKRKLAAKQARIAETDAAAWEEALRAAGFPARMSAADEAAAWEEALRAADAADAQQALHDGADVGDVKESLRRASKAREKKAKKGAKKAAALQRMADKDAAEPPSSSSSDASNAGSVVEESQRSTGDLVVHFEEQARKPSKKKPSKKKAKKPSKKKAKKPSKKSSKKPRRIAVPPSKNLSFARNPAILPSPVVYKAAAAVPWVMHQKLHDALSAGSAKWPKRYGRIFERGRAKGVTNYGIFRTVLAKLKKDVKDIERADSKPFIALLLGINAQMIYDSVRYRNANVGNRKFNAYLADVPGRRRAVTGTKPNHHAPTKKKAKKRMDALMTYYRVN